MALRPKEAFDSLLVPRSPWRAFRGCGSPLRVTAHMLFFGTCCQRLLLQCLEQVTKRQQRCPPATPLQFRYQEELSVTRPRLSFFHLTLRHPKMPNLPILRSMFTPSRHRTYRRPQLARCHNLKISVVFVTCPCLRVCNQEKAPFPKPGKGLNRDR